MAKRYVQATVTVTVLLVQDTEDDDEGVGFDFEDLADLHEQITSGDCSGKWETDVEELTGAQMADALIEQGSDPEFLGLTEDGEQADDVDPAEDADMEDPDDDE